MGSSPSEAKLCSNHEETLKRRCARASEASFDGPAITAAKNLINHVSLPSADQLLDALNSFETALTWPQTPKRVQALLELGLQRDVDFEKRWPATLDTLLQT